jgi:hypothetical protein
MTEAEPPAYNHLADFTHREYRPDHEPHPTPKGISLGPMDPRKVASLLGKVAAKSKGVKGKATVKTKTAITHGHRK